MKHLPKVRLLAARRRRRPRLPPLHLRHLRPPQGRRAHPRQQPRANVEQVLAGPLHPARDVMLGVLPCSTFGLTVLTLIPLSSGMRVVYSARFVPQRIVKLFRDHRPTVFVGIPSMYGPALRQGRDRRRLQVAPVRRLRR
ncbi:MAG: AMP-binding protein [Phycisphaerales bacterium]